MLMIRPSNSPGEWASDDLHVAGEDDEVDAPVCQHGQLALLGLFPGRGRLRGHDEFDAELRCDRPEVWVVRHHQGQLAAQLPTLVTQEQIIQAVIELRDEQSHAFGSLRIEEPRLHVEARGHLLDSALEGVPIGLQHGEIDANALKKLARLDIGVLISVDDVAPVTVQELGQAGDDAWPVWTRHEEGCKF